MRLKALTATVLLVIGAAEPALADDEAGKSLRLIGEASAPMPSHFVIDAVIKADGDGFKRDVSGWDAGLDADSGYGEVSGTCVENHCALNLIFADHQVAVSADMTGAAPGKYAVSGDGDGKGVTGVATLRPLTGPVPGLGPLAAPDAVSAMELWNLLLWNAADPGFASSDPKELPGASQHSGLADWQTASQKPANGLITTADLKALRDGRATAQAKVGWKPLGGPGWAAGYPSALLPTATAVGREQHFAGVDSKAQLVVVIEPTPTEEAFDALVDKETADDESRSGVGYNRMNGDMDLRYTKKGVVTVAAWRRRDGGMARMVLTYPEAQAETWDSLATIMPKEFTAADDLKSK